jgi:hypothetical protein
MGLCQTVQWLPLQFTAAGMQISKRMEICNTGQSSTLATQSSAHYLLLPRPLQHVVRTVAARTIHFCYFFPPFTLERFRTCRSLLAAAGIGTSAIHLNLSYTLEKKICEFVSSRLRGFLEEVYLSSFQLLADHSSELLRFASSSDAPALAVGATRLVSASLRFVIIRPCLFFVLGSLCNGFG